MRYTRQFLPLLTLENLRSSDTARVGLCLGWEGQKKCAKPARHRGIVLNRIPLCTCEALALDARTAV